MNEKVVGTQKLKMNTSLRELKELYASRESDDIHCVVGEVFVVGYLKYLIEYLETCLEVGEDEPIRLEPRE